MRVKQSAGLAPVLVDDSLDELEDLLLLSPRE
jgi:hypothetical protein